MVDTLPPGATGSAVTGVQISTVRRACKALSCKSCSFPNGFALLRHPSAGGRPGRVLVGQRLRIDLHRGAA